MWGIFSLIVLGDEDGAEFIFNMSLLVLLCWELPLGQNKSGTMGILFADSLFCSSVVPVVAAEEDRIPFESKGRNGGNCVGISDELGMWKGSGGKFG